MVKQEEIDIFFSQLSLNMDNLEELPPLAFALLFKAWKDNTTEITFNLKDEKKTDELLYIMLEYLSLIPLGDIHKYDNDLDNNRGIKTLVKEKKKFEGLNLTQALNLIHKNNSDFQGFEIVDAFWKFKKEGLIDFKFDFKNKEIELKPTKLSINLMNKINKFEEFQDLLNRFK